MASETDPLVQAKSRLRLCWSEPCFEQEEEESCDNREAFWDNFRGAAQFCVLAMHLMVLGMFLSTDPPGVLWGYMRTVPARILLGFIHFIMIFTMPSFCFITGYFSTATPGLKQSINQLRYSLTWFIQHAVFFALAGYQQHQGYRQRWFSEHPDINRTNAALEAQGKPPLEPPGFLPMPFFAFAGVDWYLWCVVIWRCVLPLLALTERPLLLSFVIGFLAIWTDAFTSVYSNAPCAFLPFFVSGFLFKNFVHEQPDQFLALRQSISAKCGFTAALLTMVVATIVDFAKVYAYVLNPLFCLYGGELAYEKLMTEAELNALYRSNMTERMMGGNQAAPVDLTCQTSTGLFQTIMFYVMSFSLIFMALSVIPSRPLPVLTKAGVNSIYIYFGHIWFGQVPLMGFSVSLMLAGVSLPAWFSTMFVFVLVIAIFSCLAQQWLRCICKPCVEPNVEECCLRRVKSASEEQTCSEA
eukprot:TRINITY_DN24081_c0_g1_i3.p1 TRINITY_DN24081_c0_g1~~TRINITY_DN24081_c0_g1_i3.p1  ORF type:complete len:526 (-),score=53.71 TRINITY_DN24081_c0_g1_i3:32-1438(-)